MFYILVDALLLPIFKARLSTFFEGLILAPEPSPAASCLTHSKLLVAEPWPHLALELLKAAMTPHSGYVYRGVCAGTGLTMLPGDL